MQTCYTLTFDNKSDNYIVLGDGRKIIYAGPIDIADYIINHLDPNDPDCPYDIVEIVAPHQTVTHNWLHTQYPVYLVTPKTIN